VPCDKVEVHEHEFGNMRDMDDFGGSQVCGCAVGRCRMLGWRSVFFVFFLFVCF
jgi:hypothetical protein